MKSKLNFRKKSVSPLIAAILLIVVAVILVTIVLNWGKMFTTDALNKTTVAELTQSDAEAFIYPKALQDGVLQFSYSPQSNFGELVISKYKVISDAGESSDTNLSSPYTLKQGTNVISLTDFSKLGLTTNTKVTIILQTTSNQYIGIKNITNNYTAPIVDLPYVMFGNSKLYIQPDQNTTTMNWQQAMDYCDNLDSNGYTDWYLPSASQLMIIWEACTAQTKSNACMNAAILATNSNFVSLVSDDYWSSTESGAGSAYSIDMKPGAIKSTDKTNGGRVRCVRDQ
jgi:hypothetical protein